jgi:hypothetical protein
MPTKNPEVNARLQRNFRERQASKISQLNSLLNDILKECRA